MACRLLEVSPSGYYQFLQALPAPRKERRLAIERAVVQIHTESRRIYGSPKITRELPKLGLAAHRNTVSRIMQECGIRAKYVRKYRPTTTQSAHAHAPSPDLLERDFTADGPNKKWLRDITYIPTDEGFLYLAGVMDAWSRSIVGWSMSNTLHATIATDALEMAINRISRAGNCYDNAMMESLWATLKKELVHDQHFRTHAEARAAIFEWINVCHQRIRIHDSRCYVSPEAFEATERIG
jgi:transposase InsO family protein